MDAEKYKEARADLQKVMMIDQSPDIVDFSASPTTMTMIPIVRSLL
jgi:hypothetical protein